MKTERQENRTDGTTTSSWYGGMISRIKKWLQKIS